MGYWEAGDSFCLLGSHSRTPVIPGWQRPLKWNRRVFFSTVYSWHITHTVNPLLSSQQRRKKMLSSTAMRAFAAPAGAPGALGIMVNTLRVISSSAGTHSGEFC